MVQIHLPKIPIGWLASVWHMGHSSVGLIFSLCLLTQFPLATANSLQCPPEVSEAIQQCVVPVAQYAENLGMKGATDSLIPQMSSNIFSELCRLINRFEQCVKESRRKCPSHVTLSLITASYGYLCNEGYSVFMENADCLMRLDQEKQVKSCHDTTMSAIKDASRNDIDVERKMNDMCRQLNFFTRCVSEPVRTQCGMNAWGVILRVLKDTTRTLMPTCSLASEFTIPPQFQPTDRKGPNNAYQRDEPTVTDNNQFQKLDPERLNNSGANSFTLATTKLSLTVLSLLLLSTAARWL